MMSDNSLQQAPAMPSLTTATKESNMIGEDILKRARLHLLLFIAVATAPFAAAMLTVAITGTRETAGLGAIIALCCIQLLYSYVFLRASIAINVIFAGLVSAAVTFLSFAVYETGRFKLGLDHYGFYDFILLYVIFSILLWEFVHLCIRLFREKSAT